MKKLVEVTILTKCGGEVMGYISVKSRKNLDKKLTKMCNEGSIKLGAISVNVAEMLELNVRFVEVN